MTTEHIGQCGWDRENRTVSAGNGASSVSYAYDALGRRVSSNLNGSSIKYQYDGEDVIAEKPYDGQQTSYINGPGIDNKISYHQVPQNIVSFETPTETDIFTDHLGTTVAVGIPERYTQYDYEAFGKTQNPPDTRYQFTGREFDSFSGLQYSRARFYDPQIGRFISEDPIGFAGGDVNLYGYVRNRPLWFRDPRGFQPGGDIMQYPNIWPPLAAAAGALAPFVPPVAIAGGGAAAIYVVGDYAANHPWEPFVNGPLNPFPIWDMLWEPNPTTACQPMPRAIPWPRSPPIPFSTPPDGPDKCYVQYEADSETCKYLPTNGARGRCWESAAERLSACNRNLPYIPPLVTW